jgi:hypothetical protein
MEQNLSLSTEITLSNMTHLTEGTTLPMNQNTDIVTNQQRITNRIGIKSLSLETKY